MVLKQISRAFRETWKKLFPFFLAKKRKGELVSPVIAPDEEFYRCVKHPYHYDFKKKIFKREIFLPPKDKREISMLRTRYTSLESAIAFGESFNYKEGECFRGIASLSYEDIREVNETTDTHDPKIQANPEYSPMHNDKYVDKDRKVYTNDPHISLPGHIDLVYNHAHSEGDVRTQLRKYAHDLSKRLNGVRMIT